MGPYMNMWDHTGPYGTIHSHTGSYGSIHDHTGGNRIKQDKCVIFPGGVRGFPPGIV